MEHIKEFCYKIGSKRNDISDMRAFKSKSFEHAIKKGFEAALTHPTESTCPYGPGEYSEAWILGFYDLPF